MSVCDWIRWGYGDTSADEERARVSEREKAAKIETERRWREDWHYEQTGRLESYIKEQEKRMKAMEDCIKGLEAKIKR